MDFAVPHFLFANADTLHPCTDRMDLKPEAIPDPDKQARMHVQDRRKNKQPDVAVKQRGSISHLTVPT